MAGSRGLGELTHLKVPGGQAHVQSNQLSNEESVEAIIRKRSLDGESLLTLELYWVLMSSFQVALSLFLARTNRYSREDMVGSGGQWESRKRTRRPQVIHPSLLSYYTYGLSRNQSHHSRCVI